MCTARGDASGGVKIEIQDDIHSFVCELPVVSCDAFKNSQNLQPYIQNLKKARSSDEIVRKQKESNRIHKAGAGRKQVRAREDHICPLSLDPD